LTAIGSDGKEVLVGNYANWLPSLAAATAKVARSLWTIEVMTDGHGTGDGRREVADNPTLQAFRWSILNRDAPATPNGWIDALFSWQVLFASARFVRISL
jgi:hypothetical protein